MTAARLDVERVTAGYGPTEIVSDISFSVSAGERLAIFGRNGVGKTTLLATLMGLTTQHRGRIALERRRPFGTPDRAQGPCWPRLRSPDTRDFWLADG